MLLFVVIEGFFRFCMQVKSGLSINAAEKVFSLMAEEDNLDLMLRVYIQGGGCSGFQYGFSFEESARDDDNIMTSKVITVDGANSGYNAEDLSQLYDSIINLLCLGKYSVFPLCSRLCDIILDHVSLSHYEVKLLIDAISYQYLSGATIDYKVGIDGEYFAVNNPNAKTTCGCGSSFSV
jgi:iron-sulfur cluster insertion protein